MLVTPLIENVGLNGGAERDDFVGIQFRMRFAVKEFLNGAADQRRARRAADEHDFFHLCWLELGVGERQFHRAHRAVNDRRNEGVKCAACKFVNKDFTVRQREAQRSRFRVR